MRQSSNKIKGAVRIFGSLSAIFCFSQISHAKTPHKTLHAAPQHAAHHAAAIKKTAFHGHAVTHTMALRRPALRHIAEHHAVMRHTIVRHSEIHVGVYHHEIYRRVAAHRPDYRHGYVAHRTLHRYIRHANYLWCVPYARDVSHIDLSGDAFLWWAEAAGRYGRGERPEAGAVLNFRSSRRIPMGHVAVVEKVINSREILVDQANWVPDQVSREVPVIDVSPNNNWSEVQVSIGDGRFGSTYPTYGFIYNQQPGGMTYANSGSSEVAEAPITHKIRLIAPNRTLR